MTQNLFNAKTYGALGNDNADDTAAIQAALNAARTAGGGIVYIPNGTYRITASLEIFKNTTLRLEPAATIKRNAAISPMLLNGRKGIDSFKGYSGNGNIIIEGGTWEGNTQAFPTQFSHIMFMHAENITIQDTIILNNSNSHFIELNSTKKAVVYNCIMKGFIGDRPTEAIQIDGAFSSAVFPHLGEYDNTICEDITISHCTITDHVRGVGSHTSVPGPSWTHHHRGIRIVNNHFRNLQHQAVRGYDWRDVTVSGNTIITCGEGITLRAVEANNFSATIINNTIDQLNRVGCGIEIIGATAIYYDVTITGNVIRNSAGTHPENIEAAIVIRNAMRFNVADNVVSDSANEGIRVADGCNRFTVSGNSVNNMGKDAILIEAGCSRGIVTGNNVDIAGKWGIAVTDSEDINVTGNSVRNASSFSLYLTSGASNCIVSSNKVTNSGNVAVRISANSHQNLIQGNHIRLGHGDGITLTNTCNDNLISSNHALGKILSGGVRSVFSQNLT